MPPFLALVRYFFLVTSIGDRAFLGDDIFEKSLRIIQSHASNGAADLCRGLGRDAELAP
jgi:hypothetical protein